MALGSSLVLRWTAGGALALLAVAYWLARDEHDANAATPVAYVNRPSTGRAVEAEQRTSMPKDVANLRLPIELSGAATSEVAPADGCIVSVLDPQGRPAADARLWVENSLASDAEVALAATKFSSNVDQLAHAIGIEVALDANARVVLARPSKAVRVGARAPGLAGWSVIARVDSECVLELEPSHDIAVRVRDGSGQPLRGVDIVLGHKNQWLVEVSASSFESPELGMTPITATLTDETGSALLRDVESFVDPRFDTWWIAAPLAGASPDFYELHLDDLPQNELLFEVGATGSIRFELRDQQGALQRVSCLVRLEPLPRDSSGRACLQLEPGVAHTLVDGRAVFQRVELQRAFRAELGVWIDGARQITVEPLTRSGEMRTAAFIDSR